MHLLLGFSLNQYSFFPAHLDKLNFVRAADSKAMPGVSQKDVLGRRLERSVITEELAALGLQDPDSSGIDSDRVLADQDSLIFPDILIAEMMRADAVEKGIQHEQDIQLGPLFDVIFGPEPGQVCT